MRHSLEVRIPLLDYRIVEFALNLDPALKIKGKEQKYLLKKLLSQYLPEHLWNRPKRGFSVPLNSWLKNELRPLLDENLSVSNINASEILDPEEVKKLVKKWREGKDYLYNRVNTYSVLTHLLQSGY